MRWFKFLVSLFATLGLVLLLNTYRPFGSPIPPLGKFIDPFGGFWQNADPVSAGPSGELSLPGLEAPVKVIFDERLVPHIFAQNEVDLCFAQGYVVASMRLFQMETATRAISGRLSELIGPGGLENDRLMRRQGMVTAAGNQLLSWQRLPGEMKLVEAYTAGVNAYIDQLDPGDYPLEYKLIHAEPEAWTPLKTCFFVKYMARSLSLRQRDLESTNALNALGREAFDFFFPEYNPRQDPVIPSEVTWNFDGIPPAEIPAGSMIGEMIRFDPIPVPPPFIGSNNWAVSGRKTAGGHPLLCNDPHLELSMPSIWFEVQLQTPDMNVYGVALPGIPGVMIGFNKNYAWGNTNVGQDVLDWYRIQWANGEKSEYLLDGAPAAVEQKVEQIVVRGWKDPVLDTVKYTVWGPVVYESAEAPYQDMAMRWLGHDQAEERHTGEIGAILQMMKGKDCEDFEKGLSAYEVPAMNFAFAAKDGDIAMFVSGKLPIKSTEQGRFVQDGSRSENAWKGFIPRSQTPKVKNPSRNFVASANQRSTHKSYPYYYNGGFDDYRGRILNRLLEDMDSITIEQMMALQNNTYNLQAEEALPLMLKLVKRNEISEQGKKWLSELEAWDFYFEAELKTPILFTEWFDRIYELSFEEMIHDSIPFLRPESWRLIELLESHPEHYIFDRSGSPEIETASAIVTIAFQQVLEELDKALEDENYVWSRHKNTVIPHLLRLPAFTVSNINNGGTTQALNSMKRSHGPSWRMIVELGDEPTAYGVYPGGQSGNPGSFYYDNAIGHWTRGEYYELFYMKDADDDRQPVLSRLQLIPEK